MLEPVTLAVEGITDAAVVRRLLDEAHRPAGPEHGQTGKQALDRSLDGYNRAARFSCWLVLRDMDRDAACVAALARRLLPVPAPHMRLHIAVRAVEAWLLADAERIAEQLAVRVGCVPSNPEALANPKRSLIDVARHSRRRGIRDAIVPVEGTTAQTGPGYTGFVIEFVESRWRPSVAAKHAPSLARLRAFLGRHQSKEG